MRWMSLLTILFLLLARSADAQVNSQPGDLEHRMAEGFQTCLEAPEGQACQEAIAAYQRMMGMAGSSLAEFLNQMQASLPDEDTEPKRGPLLSRGEMLESQIRINELEALMDQFDRHCIGEQADAMDRVCGLLEDKVAQLLEEW